LNALNLLNISVNRVIFHLKNCTEIERIELLNVLLNIVQHPLDLSAAVDTTAEAATSSFGGQAVSCPILKAGRVPTQEVYRDLYIQNIFIHNPISFNETHKIFI
jgi:hypothetical protein